MLKRAFATTTPLTIVTLAPSDFDRAARVALPILAGIGFGRGGPDVDVGSGG